MRQVEDRVVWGASLASFFVFASVGRQVEDRVVLGCIVVLLLRLRVHGEAGGEAG